VSVKEVDKAMLDSLKSILEDRFGLLIETYMSDSEGRCSRLKDAIENLDYAAICHEAHGLKGSSRNIGANSFADICAIIETQASHEDQTGLQQNFAALENRLAAVFDELKEL